MGPYGRTFTNCPVPTYVGSRKHPNRFLRRFYFDLTGDIKEWRVVCVARQISAWKNKIEELKKRNTDEKKTQVHSKRPRTKALEKVPLYQRC